MKIRHGYVSNSSSSSFVCYGVKITDAMVYELLLHHGISVEGKYNCHEGMEEFLRQNEMTCVYDEGDWYIGWCRESHDEFMPTAQLGRGGMTAVCQQLIKLGLGDEIPRIYTGQRAC